MPIPDFETILGRQQRVKANSTMRKVRVEDYLIAIDQLCDEATSTLAKSGQIAKSLGIANGTVSSTLLKLAAEGLIVHQPYDGVKLTDLGRVRFHKVARRLRIIELLLDGLLHWESEPIIDEARRIEVVASDRFVDGVDGYLGFPALDRFGQPIPRSDE